MIKIGAYLPMTGGVAAYGDMEWSGIQVAKDMEPQVLGKKIDVVLVDTKSDKIEAANAVSLLVEKEKVIGILGEAISGNSMAGNPISEAAKIPSVSPTATNPLVTQGKKFAFRACFIDPFQGQVAARFARNELKAQTAALIIDQAQDYCVGLANYFEKEFEKLGGKIVSKTYIQTGDQDFSAQLSAVQATKPDIIYAPNYYTEDALMAKQARDLGIKLPILTGDGAQDETLIKVGGTAVENMYFTGHFHKAGGHHRQSQGIHQALRREIQEGSRGLRCPRGGCLLHADRRYQTGRFNRWDQDSRCPCRHQGFQGGFGHHYHGCRRKSHQEHGDQQGGRG